MYSLARIVGHHRQTRLLSRAIARESLPPTLMFAGPAGIGKFAVARAAAAVVNCPSPQRDRGDLAVDACAVCRSCDRIARGLHVDVIAVEPDERASIKIDVVRGVLERSGYRPFEGFRRVVILRDADALEPAAQNALLKSLEEPPPATSFILTTAAPGALLPTVQSRCMRIRFARLTAREVAQVLVRDHEMAEHDARAAAALSDGRVGVALGLASTDVAVLREVALQLLRQAAGTAAVASRLQAALPLYAGTAKKERSREDLSVILRTMASMLRDLELIGSGGDDRLLANPVAADDLASLARTYAGDRARAAYAAVDRAIAALDKNAGVKLVSEWLAVQL